MFWCDDCKGIFISQHVTQYRCCDCDRDFVNEAALLNHIRDMGKPRTAQHGCDLCKKVFFTKTSLNQHKNSPAHKPICAPLTCIGSPGCGRVFTSASSMIRHLESGTCISGLTRAKVNELIISQDTSHVITSMKAIENSEIMPQSPSIPDDSWAMLTPSSTGHSSLERRDSWSFLSTESATSGRGIDTPGDSLSVGPWSVTGEGGQVPPIPLWFLCPLCPPTSNRFKTAEDLERHSMSPAHSPKIFHCPTWLVEGNGEGRGMSFSTLSGVAMHLESGACRGGMNAVENMVDFVNQRLQELGFRRINLLAG